MSQPTADELWAWLLACTTCGAPHEFRRADPPSSGWTWARDGHGYHSRDNVGPRLVRLREQWEALRAAESRSGALAGEAPPEPGSGRSGEAGPQDDPT